MSKVNLLSICNIVTGKLDANSAEENGVYPYFTCAPEPLRINTYAFEGDVILLAGNNASGNFHCQRYKGKFNAYQRTYVISAKKGYSIDYIYYNFIINLKHLQKIAQGSQTKFLTMQILNDFYTEDIAYEEQLIFSKILSKIDKKIQINYSIARELEAMAKTLYEYWFLQFDYPNEEGKPYKSSGGKMVYNEELKREIPKGWKVESLSILISRNNTKYNNKEVKKVIDLSNIPSNSIYLSSFNTTSDFATNLFKMDKFDLLFGSIRPYLHKACFAPFDGVVTGTIHSFKVKNENDYAFVLSLITSEAFFNYADSNSQGTKMPIIKYENLLNYRFAYNQKMVEAFNKIISIKEKVSSCIVENQELSSLRDFLLPMLMNGQVTFKKKNIEKENQEDNVSTLSYIDRFNQWKQGQGLAARGQIDENAFKLVFDAMDEDDKK